MDGLKGRLNESIQFRLSVYIGLSIVLIALFSAGFSLLFAFDEAHELQDDTLREIALHFDSQHLPMTEVVTGEKVAVADPESRVMVQYKRPNGAVFHSSSEENLFVKPLPDGFQTLVLGASEYRVFLRTLKDGLQVAVAQDTAARNEIAWNAALRALMPIVFLIPLLLYLVADIIKKMFLPIRNLTDRLLARQQSDLSPLDETSLPVEMRPFGVAINRQFSKIETAFELQKRFIADAAHELRTPVTALSLQMEQFDPSVLDEKSRTLVGKLQAISARMQALLAQLLSMARTEALQSQHQEEWVSVNQTFTKVLEALYPLAEQKGIDVGVISDEEFTLPMSEFVAFTLIRNLVDNAIRYTPKGGHVDLYAARTHSQDVIEITDDGPGIPKAERSRVLDPFFRIAGSKQEGSGLGLSIVKKVMDALNGRIELEEGDLRTGRGLKVRLIFPRRK